MIKAVIFDVDGTLIDSVDLHAQAWQEALANRGKTVSFGEIRHQIGMGGDKILDRYFSREVVDRDGEAIERERGELFRRDYLPKVHPFPGVRDLFQRLLADGKKIALGSSGKKEEVALYRKIAGVDDLLHHATSSDDAEESKPDPDIFHAARAGLGGIDPGEILVIGDTPYDVQAAAKAGIRTIALLCGGFGEAELREAGALTIYRDPADLLDKYDESPLARG